MPPPHKAGRPVLPFWNELHFERRKMNGKLLAVCVICQRELKNTSHERLLIHRNRCKVYKKEEANFTKVFVETQNKYAGRQEEEKEESATIFKQETQSEENPIEIYIESSSDHQFDVSDDELMSQNEVELEIHQSKPVKTENVKIHATQSTDHSLRMCKLRRIELVGNKTTYQNEDINSAFAEFFFESNLPFTILQSPYFENFLHKLNRTYRLPSLKNLNGVYLENILEKYKITASADEQEAVLILSGWKHFPRPSETYIVAGLYLIDEDESRRVFLNVWDLDFNSDLSTAEQNILKESAAMAMERFNAKFSVVLSDNLEASSDSNAEYLICHSYIAALFANATIDQEVSNTITKILKELQTEENQTQIMSSGGVGVVLPWDSKWCTYRDSFQCYLQNSDIVRELISQDKLQVTELAREKIIDDQFLKTVQHYVKVLEPVCRVIYLSQKTKTTLAEMVEEWIRLELPLEFKPQLEQYRNIVLRSFALTANFLHPEYRGRALSEQQMEIVESFLLEKLDSNGLDDVLLYKKNQGIFETLTAKGVTNYRTFWNFASRKHLSLATCALRLLNVPMSVSYLDKWFSNHSAVHLSARNRLGLDAYRKMLEVNFTLKFAEGNFTQY